VLCHIYPPLIVKYWWEKFPIWAPDEEDNTQYEVIEEDGKTILREKKTEEQEGPSDQEKSKHDAYEYCSIFCVNGC